jgi:hypothetical protein
VSGARGLLRIACATALLLVGCSVEHRGATPDSRAVDRRPGSAERVRRSALHAVHAQATPSIGCEQCHELVGGEYFRAKSWRCTECHADGHLALHAVASPDSGARECGTCHDFSSESKAPIPCATCHAQPQGALPAIAPHDAKQRDEDCGTCHRAHQEPTLVSTQCETCHKEPASGHAKPDIPIKGCASCHGYHEQASVAAGRCTNCHHQSRAQVSFKATFAGGHVTCATCHRPHRFFKAEVIGCRDECHKNVVALAEAKAKEHRGCIGCHDNHDVLGSPRTACLKCHGGKISPKHPKDRVTGTPCVACHPPHRGAGTSLAVDCTSCHRTAPSDRGFHQGADNKGPVCRDCHKPHDFDLSSTGTALCLGCHGDKPFKNAPSIHTYVKHANCFGCHGESVRHQPAGPRAECATCHKDKGAIVRKGHTNCIGCHDPHTPQQRKPCGTCHQDEAAIARKDHKNCTNCHDPHTAQQKQSCGSCHRVEAASTPKPHQQCTTCHDQHSTEVKKQCAECHPERATGVHAPVKGGCINCHRPHGPNGQASPPACTTCHKDLPLMHQVSGHKQCTSCHRSHGEQPGRKPATCIACHEDRVNHEPGATTCFGCHPFGGDQ